jgi:DAACS family dicarboxylate/amino acid:cation (Na+ or H+) symporter
VLKKIPLYWQIIIAMVLGAALGLWLGKDATPFGELGKLIIQLTKMMATPLMFFTIIYSILHTDVEFKDGLRMLVLACVNAFIATLIGLFLANTLKVGLHLKDLGFFAEQAIDAQGAQKLDFLKTLISFVPSNFIQPFLENTVITVVVLALLIGTAARQLRHFSEDKPLFAHMDYLFAGFLKIFEIMLTWVVKLIPIAVFGVVAKSVGEYGFSPVKSLLLFVAVVILGFLIHVTVVYQAWIYFFAGIPLKKFWVAAREPVSYGMGANSSLATLPVTLRALDQLGVSRSASTLGACVGTNLNNDGIILYEAMAVMFIAQAMGIDLTLWQQFYTIFICMIAAMGVAGVPEAGFVSLAVILATLGLPMELLPLLLTVDWILGRLRTVVNVLSDMTVSIVLSKMEKIKR